MTVRRRLQLFAFVGVSLAQVNIALADQFLTAPGACIVKESDATNQCVWVQPLWMDGIATERHPFTLDALAHLAAPILWFSPREFLLLEGKSRISPVVLRWT